MSISILCNDFTCFTFYCKEVFTPIFVARNLLDISDALATSTQNFSRNVGTERRAGEKYRGGDAKFSCSPNARLDIILIIDCNCCIDIWLYAADQCGLHALPKLTGADFGPA